MSRATTRKPRLGDIQLAAMDREQRQIVKRVDRARNEPKKPPRTSATFSEIPLCESQARTKSHDFRIVAVRTADVFAESRDENAYGFIRQSTVEVRAREFDRVNAIDVDAWTVERPLGELFREDLAGFRAFSACEPNKSGFVDEPRKIFRKPCADLCMTRRAHQILSTPHGSGEKEMETRIRRLRARELFQDLRCFSVPSGREMDARRFDRNRWLKASASEFFREERRSFLRAIGKTKDAREFDAGADERRPLRNRASIAMLRALKIAACKQTSRDLEVRRRGALDRMEREVVRSLCFLMATGECERANEHRNRGLALWINLER